MVDNESLHEHGEWSGDNVGPHESSAIDGASHHEVAYAPVAEYIADGGGFDDNRVRRSFVGSVDSLDLEVEEVTEGAEGTEGVEASGGKHVRVCSLLSHFMIY